MAVQRAFYFHYNKPASQRAGKVQLSLHYKGVCYLVDNISCYVSTAGRVRSSSPRFVMSGKASEIRFRNGIAEII